ncbi:MAG: hypothetical protein QXK12_06225 [Candidatus Nezhaarchaeales archaeon]
MGDGEWTRIMGYGRRWTVETAFSTFKRTFGDYRMAKELKIKAFIYNHKPININLTPKQNCMEEREFCPFWE